MKVLFWQYTERQGKITELLRFPKLKEETAV